MNQPFKEYADQIISNDRGGIRTSYFNSDGIGTHTVEGVSRFSNVSWIQAQIIRTLVNAKIRKQNKWCRCVYDNYLGVALFGIMDKGCFEDEQTNQEEAE